MTARCEFCGMKKEVKRVYRAHSGPSTQFVCYECYAAVMEMRKVSLDVGKGIRWSEWDIEVATESKKK